MFSAPLEVKFYFGSIRENFGQHLLTNMSLKAPKNVKILENGPLAVCNTQNAFNCNSANIEDMRMIEIFFLLLLK